MEEDLKRSAALILKCAPDELKIYKLKFGGRVVSNVWKLRTSDERLIAVKKVIMPKFEADERHSPFDVEVKVLKFLNSMGCSVPKLIGYENSKELILMDWGGDTTLDDFCQSNPKLINLEKISEKVIARFCEIELAFSAGKAWLLEYMFPFDYAKLLNQQLREHISMAKESIGELARQRNIVKPSWKRNFDELLDELQLRMSQYPMAPGVLDYNSRNIVIEAESESVYFIDFSRIGFDWSARRLVQYCTSLGANRKSGNFISILNPEIIRKYAEQMEKNGARRLPALEIMAQVEHHHILFFLTAISKIVAAVKNPKDESNRLLLKAWGEPSHRLKSAFKELLKPLGEDALAKRLREVLSELT